MKGWDGSTLNCLGSRIAAPPCSRQRHTAILIRFIAHLIWICFKATIMGVDGMSPRSNECPNTACFINLFISNLQTSSGQKQFALVFMFMVVTDNNDSNTIWPFLMKLLMDGMVFVRICSFLFVLFVFLNRRGVSLQVKVQQIHSELYTSCADLQRRWSHHCYSRPAESCLSGWIWSVWCWLDCRSNSEVRSNTHTNDLHFYILYWQSQ